MKPPSPGIRPGCPTKNAITLSRIGGLRRRQDKPRASWGCARSRAPNTRLYGTRDVEGRFTMMKVTQHLWFEKDMEAAIGFYTSLIPGSSVHWISGLPADTPSGPAGSVRIAAFTLGDQRYMAIEAGPLDSFNHSFSIMIECETQAEIDRLWNALKEGGATERCGWLKDRWGLSWQIIPRRLGELMSDPDRAKARRVADAMLKMVKFDIAGLEAAATG
jgi:predicted 3-demethylubiquinone-9 3-methyltransferase (glyoxalase superfamily)